MTDRSRHYRLDPLPVPKDDPGFGGVEDVRRMVAQRDADEKFQAAMMLSGTRRTGPVPANPNDTRVLRICFATGYVPSASNIAS